MNIKKAAVLLITTAFMAVTSPAEETPPTLSLSKAAKLAEDAIASASLPADGFLRSITLVQTADAPAYYRATFKPPPIRRAQVGSEPPTVTIDFIRIVMDGKVSFEKEERGGGRSIRAK